MKNINTQFSDEQFQAVDALAKKYKMKRSAFVRFMVFEQLDQDVLSFIIDLAKKKNVAPFTYVNAILRSFVTRYREIGADLQKKLGEFVLDFKFGKN